MTIHLTKEQIKQLLLDAFQFRYACKAFDPERKISAEDFRFIMEIARLSPSSMGIEPWNFVVVQNPAIREKMREVSWGAQGQLPTASHFVVVLARKTLDVKYDAPYVSYIMKEVHQIPDDIVDHFLGPAYKGFQETDFNLLESERAMFDWACKQTYLATGNMMNAAAQIGIDSCAIEGFNREQMEQILCDEGILDQEHFGVALLVAFGYRAQDPHFPKSRLSMDELWRTV